LQGVTPDLVLPSVNSHLDVGESSLENPLEYDTIAPADYQKVNRVRPFFSELKKRSDSRVAGDVDFAFIREEVERYKKIKAEKSISLNEEVRLKEKKEADERSKARKKELASRPEPPWKVYDISLKQARMPGLPEPTVRTNASKSSASSPVILNKEGAKEETKKPVDSDSTDVAKANPSDPDEAAETDPDVTAPDITLEETKRILLDYIDLSIKGRGVAQK
jgi:carboxyl-terminal processing protease